MRPEVFAESSKRSRFNEACRLYKYLDSNGIATLGWGYNLQGSNTQALFDRVGINYAAVMVAPTAIDSEPENAVAECITQAQADALFDLIYPTYIGEARGLLASGIYDAFTDARQGAWADMTYNMGAGADGLGGFHATISLLNNAQHYKNSGNTDAAHTAFVQAGQHLKASTWYGQVGDRAKRNVAMIVKGVWCRIDGDGSDI